MNNFMAYFFVGNYDYGCGGVCFVDKEIEYTRVPKRVRKFDQSPIKRKL
jgi:hypothetical protein